jgi:hypothetical protein
MGYAVDRVELPRCIRQSTMASRVTVPQSWHHEPPFVDQEAESVDGQLARKCLLPVHEIADEDKEHDEDVKVHG